MDITSGTPQITVALRTTGGRILASSARTARRARETTPGHDDIAVEEAARLFCDSHASPATARSYRTALTRLTDFCHAEEVTACRELTPSLLAVYQSTLGDLAPSTRWHRMSVVRAFLRWASRAGWCGAACSDVISPVRQRRPARLAPWSAEECRRLLAAGESWRDRALVATLVASGARIGEVVAATAGDFDGECLVLTGKTGPRSVPLGPSACSALTWYLRHRHPDDPAVPLFLGRQGRLSARQARDVVHLVCRRARLSPRGPHAFRHAAASRWLRAGIPLPVVSAALGHARTSTTVDNYGLALAADLACGLSADPLWAEDGARTAGRPVGEKGTA
ncbi:MAG: tyrosine-type recombinase/integrase [Candidatus Dormibacteria bacterium]